MSVVGVGTVVAYGCGELARCESLVALNVEMIMSDVRVKLIEMYLDYVNNFITVVAFAEHYGFTADQALLAISLGRSVHETVHPDC